MKYLTFSKNNPVNYFDRFDSIFDNWFFPEATEKRTFAVDVKQDEKQYILTADMPGYEDKDLEINVENKLLTISASKESKTDTEEAGYIVKERSTTSMKRSFTVPDDADAESITAHLKNGVLELTIPRTEQKKPKRIEVKTA